MNKKSVKVDIDNTINDLTKAQLTLYEKRHGVKIPYERVLKYDYSGLGDLCAVDELFSMFEEKELWDSLRPAEWSQEYLSIMNDKYDVYITTATHPDNFAWKCAWMEEYFPYIPSDRIIRIHDKQLLMTDYSIDDYQRNLCNDMGHRILIDAPWNRGVRDDVYGFHRVPDLRMALDVMRTIDREEDDECVM